MSSVTFLTGSSALIASTLGWLVVMMTGAKSRATSYGSFWSSGPVASGPLKPAAACSRPVQRAPLRSSPPCRRLRACSRTISGCPSVSSNLSPMVRARRSSELPAGAGTSMRMGRSGRLAHSRSTRARVRRGLPARDNATAVTGVDGKRPGKKTGRAAIHEQHSIGSDGNWR